MNMGWNYKKVVMIGATSGIGEALTHRFIEEGCRVIVVGRRQDRLDDLVNKHGIDKVQGVRFDITDLAAIPLFAQHLISANEDIDCIFMNSGIQRKADFSDPDSIDMTIIQEENTVNYLAPLALTKAFLPFLKAKGTDSSLIYTTSALALLPIPRVPNYCASKAAMHHFILCLREQLKKTPIKVIELLPPAVQTELHDAKHQPDLKDGGLMGMPLAQFTDEAFELLASGQDQIPIGGAKQFFEGFEAKRQEIFAGLIKLMEGGIPNMPKTTEKKD